MSDTRSKPATREDEPYRGARALQAESLRALTLRLAERDRELARVNALGPSAVETFGQVASEIMAHLITSGPLTVERVGRDLALPPAATKAYFLALTRAGQVISPTGQPTKVQARAIASFFPS